MNQKHKARLVLSDSWTNDFQKHQTHWAWPVYSDSQAIDYFEPVQKDKIGPRKSLSCCSKPVIISFFCRTQKKMFWSFSSHFSSNFHVMFLSIQWMPMGTKVFGYQYYSKYLVLHSTVERKSYKFGMTWGGVFVTIHMSVSTPHV